MKRSHLFAYYCSLLVPIGVLIGLGLGELLGAPSAWVGLGILAGGLAAVRLLRASLPPSSPGRADGGGR